MDKTKRIGHYVQGSSVGGESYLAYVPNLLPPTPTIELDDIYSLLDQANVALGRLDGMSSILPDPSLFIYMYVRKEAVLSSQIEGTQSSLSDLLFYENERIKNGNQDDVKEVSRYVNAMNYGLERIKEFPLSLRLIREIHQRLIENARGGNKQPGEFRKSQNWIGGAKPSKAIFVPPPPENLMVCLDNLEKYLHDDSNQFPILVKVAIIHVQFETIHPFLDGNGRLGRLLITFILCVAGVLKEPLLYLSLYFKKNRTQYYESLQNVRTKGDWEEWIKFFLKGVKETADQATKTVQDILALFADDEKKIQQSNKTGAALQSIHKHFQKSPISTSTEICEGTGLSRPAVLRNVGELEEMGIVRETTGKNRNKIFSYARYMEILSSES